jgi:hypothetical protein
MLPNATIVYDARRPTLAVRKSAQPSDMLVVPSTPRPDGLRGAASRIARAVPDSSVLVVIDPTEYRRVVVSAAPADQPLELRHGQDEGGRPQGVGVVRPSSNIVRSPQVTHESKSIA